MAVVNSTTSSSPGLLGLIPPSTMQTTINTPSTTASVWEVCEDHFTVGDESRDKCTDTLKGEQTAKLVRSSHRAVQGRPEVHPL